MENATEKSAQANDEKKFDNFIKSRKDIYREIGADVLAEANRDKEIALKDVQFIQKNIEEYKFKTESLRLEIDNQKANIINRVLEFRKINELERKLHIQENILKYNEKRLKQKKELVEAYDYLITKEVKLVIIIEEAQGENAQWDEKKKSELISEEDARNVAKLAEKHGVFFVHDMVDIDWNSNSNDKAIDTSGLDFNDQLDILQGLEPTISASTLCKGRTQKTSEKGSWGVFLSGGRVLGGKESDATTIASGLKDRRFCSSDSMTTESIENAILRKEFKKYNNSNLTGDSYNELVVENPEIAGVYVKWNDEMPVLNEDGDIYLENDANNRYDKWWSSLSDIMQRNIPIFILNRESNTARMLYDIDLKNRSFKLSSEYDPKNISNMPGIYKDHLGRIAKHKAVMRVFDKATGVILGDEKKEYATDIV